MDDINWSDPAARLALIERVGPDEYNRLLEEHFKKTTLLTAGGHDIRRVQSRFGAIYTVGSTGKGYAALNDAIQYAEDHPRKG